MNCFSRSRSTFLYIKGEVCVTPNSASGSRLNILFLSVVYIAENILKHTACTHVMFVPVSDLYGKASLKVEDDHRVQMISLAIANQKTNSYDQFISSLNNSSL